MMGIKNRDFKTQTNICLEQLVPEEHFYRLLETHIPQPKISNCRISGHGG